MRHKPLHGLLSCMDRRTLLGRGAAIMGGLFSGLSLKPKSAYGRMKPAAGNQSAGNPWNVIVVGEAMVCRPFSEHDEPEFLAIRKLMKESDVTYAHCEMIFGELDELPWTSAGRGGGSTMMIAEPQVAKDLKWMGVDIMSLANNHSCNWGAPGILSTIRACKQSGITCAGTGRDLEEARCPAFIEKRRGRVALVSVSSGNGPNDWAGLAKGSIPGRPGINPLRLTMKYEVDHATAEQLKAAGKKLGVLRVSRNAPQEFTIGQTEFSYVDGDKFEITSVGYPADIEGNLRSIREAKEMADFVMVAHHTQPSEGARGDKPCRFAREFARAAIDAGADIYIGHGWHWTLGIEIYKNKPLIHGTGDFFCQDEYTQRVPADAFEAHGFDLDNLTTLNSASYPLHPGENDPLWRHSAVYQLKFEDMKLTEIRLHPIEMGMDITGEKPRITRSIGVEHPKADGRPLMAYGAQAQKILERIQKLSADDYGTKIVIRDGIGICTL